MARHDGSGRRGPACRAGAAAPRPRPAPPPRRAAAGRPRRAAARSRRRAGRGASLPARRGRRPPHRLVGERPDGQLHVRDTVAERVLETWVLVDRSASMDFGTAVLEKRDLAAAAVAAVRALTDRPGNRLGRRPADRADPASGAGPARAGPRGLCGRCSPRPGPTPGTGGARSGRRPRPPPPRRRRPGLRVIVSDFLVRGRARLANRAPAAPARPHRHDVLAVEVVDPRDEELPDVGLLCSSTRRPAGAARCVPTARLRERFAGAAAEHSARPPRPRCAGPAPSTWCCAPTATGSPTSRGSSPRGAAPLASPGRAEDTMRFRVPGGCSC